MALIVSCSNPQALLDNIRREIKRPRPKSEHIDTWDITVVDGEESFVHTPEQWRNTARFVAKLCEGELRFYIKPAVNSSGKKIPVTRFPYAVYHGRFTEMLFAHFRDELQKVEATPPLK